MSANRAPGLYNWCFCYGAGQAFEEKCWLLRRGCLSSYKVVPIFTALPGSASVFENTATLETGVGKVIKNDRENLVVSE